ncbi:MAG: uroporphyrinogen decarboxylase family protein [Acidobacteria bacterium]|nr:uroporphyrinogen decarboxylase family protein [Acidobacteriota bacterium]
MNGRERILASIQGQPTGRLPLMPITMMFAADQIGARYLDYVTDYRVLAEGQMRTAEKFGFDYVSAISDPAREPADLGAAIEFFPDQPPAVIEDRALLADKTRLAALRVPDPLAGRRMSDRVHGVALLKQRAGGDLLVEGWVEGPCAEAADLRGINTLMVDFYDDPAFVDDLFEFTVAMELEFAKAQIQAGADIIGVGDAAASLVGPKFYQGHVWAYEKKLIQGIHDLGAKVRLHICGNTRRILEGMGRTGADIVDLDYLAPVAAARAAMGPRQVLLGNLEPVGVLRNGSPEIVRDTVAACHRDAGENYIAGAGCEVCRDTPEANLRALCEYAHVSR